MFPVSESDGVLNGAQTKVRLFSAVARVSESESPIEWSREQQPLRVREYEDVSKRTAGDEQHVYVPCICVCVYM